MVEETRRSKLIPADEINSAWAEMTSIMRAKITPNSEASCHSWMRYYWLQWNGVFGKRLGACRIEWACHYQIITSFLSISLLGCFVYLIILIYLRVLVFLGNTVNSPYLLGFMIWWHGCRMAREHLFMELKSVLNENDSVYQKHHVYQPPIFPAF